MMLDYDDDHFDDDDYHDDEDDDDAYEDDEEKEEDEDEDEDEDDEDSDDDDDDDDEEEEEVQEEGNHYYDGDGKTKQGALIEKRKLACNQAICQPPYLPYVKSLSPHPATLLQTALRFEAISDLGWCRCTLCRDAPGIRSLASLSLRYRRCATVCAGV